jgi:signal peptidase I
VSASGGRLPWLTIAICAAGMAVAAWLFWLLGPSAVMLVRGDRIGRAFYVPSESMLPTLQLNDRVAPLQIGAAGPQRGDVIVFRAPTSVRVARVAAIGGDTIQMRGGVVVLNGVAVPQTGIGAGPALDGMPTRLLAERFPGDARTHRILDLGASPQDDTAPLRVAPGKLFVLGDNRDRAADSRIPLAEEGVGQVDRSAVIGLVDAVYWAKDRARIGRPIDTIGNVR